MPTLKFDITGDNSQLIGSLRQTQDGISRTSSLIQQTGNSANATFQKMSGGADDLTSALERVKKVASTMFVGFAAKEFVQEIINVRKEFKSLEVSFSTLLGDDKAGKKMFSDITQFATSTPMLEKDLAKAAQTMLSFNVESEKVMPLLKQIGDISMGDANKLNSLTLAFSQVSSTGKLMGQDLLQMVNAGFNPLAEISRTTGKSMKELKDDMSNGKISVEMVEDAFKSATSEGGKFQGMLDNMSKTMEGSFSNLEGAIQKLFNELGTAIEDSVVSGTDMATAAINALAENSDKLVATVQVLVATYGTYKAASMVAAAANMAQATGITALTAAETIHYYWLVICEKAQALLNKTMLANPYVAAAAALVGLVTAIISFSDNTDQATEVTKKFNEEQKEAAQKAQEHKAEIENLIQVATDESKSQNERTSALVRLKSAYPSIFAKYDTEILKLSDIAALKREIAELENQRAQAKLQNDINESLKEEDRLIQGNNKETEEKLGGRRRQTNLLMNKKALDTVLPQFLAYAKTLTPKEQKEFAAEFASRFNSNRANGFARMKLPTGNGQLSDDIALTYGEAQGTINTLIEWSKQKGKKSTYGAELKKAQDANKKATKTLNDIKAHPEKYTREDYDKAAADKKSSEDEVKKLGGKTYDEQEKERQKNANKSKKDAKDIQRQQEEILENQQALADAQEKQTLESAKQLAQTILQARQYELDAMDEGSAKVLAQIKLNYDKEAQAIKDDKKDVIKANEQAAREMWEAQNPNAKKKGINWESYKKKNNLTFDLTAEQSDMFSKRAIANEASRSKQLQEEFRTRLGYILDFYKEYGTIEEKRAAITRQYNLQIAKENDEYTKASLEMQKKAALEQLDVTDIFKNINWDGVFSTLEGHTKEYLLGLRDELQSLLSSGQLKTVEDIEKVQQKIIEINGEVAKKGGLFGFTGTKAQERQRLNENVQNARDNLNAAKIGELKASTKLFDAQKSGKQSAIIAAEAELAKARLKTADATQKAKQAEDAAKTISAQSIADWFSDAEEFIANKGLDQLPHLAKSLGFGTASEAMAKGLSGFSSASGAAKDFASGNYIGAITKGISAIQSFGSALGIGGGNEDEVHKITEENTKAIKANSERIDALKKSIDKQTGAQAVSTAKSAITAQEDTNKRVMQTLEAQMGYWSAHHSNTSYADDSYIASLYNQTVGNAIKAGEKMVSSISGLNNIYSMTPEQIAAIKTYMPALWEYLTTVGKYDKSEYWEAVVEQAGKLEEISNQVKQNITGMTFDSMVGNFVSSLMDMSKSTREFSDDMTKSITQALLNIQINKILGGKLQDFYDKFYDALSDNNLTEYESAYLTEMYESIVQEGKKIRNNIATITGYDDISTSEAQGSINGIKSISEDTANEIVGRLTAMQLSVERNTAITSESMLEGIRQMTIIAGINSEGRDILNDILTQQVLSNGFLEDIVRYSKVSAEYAVRLERIDNNINTKL